MGVKGYPVLTLEAAALGSWRMRRIVSRDGLAEQVSLHALAASSASTLRTACCQLGEDVCRRTHSQADASGLTVKASQLAPHMLC